MGEGPEGGPVWFEGGLGGVVLGGGFDIPGRGVGVFFGFGFGFGGHFVAVFLFLFCVLVVVCLYSMSEWYQILPPISTC